MCREPNNISSSNPFSGLRLTDLVDQSGETDKTSPAVPEVQSATPAERVKPAKPVKTFDPWGRKDKALTPEAYAHMTAVYGTDPNTKRSWTLMSHMPPCWINTYAANKGEALDVADSEAIVFFDGPEVTCGDSECNTKFLPVGHIVPTPELLARAAQIGLPQAVEEFRKTRSKHLIERGQFYRLPDTKSRSGLATVLRDESFVPLCGSPYYVPRDQRSPLVANNTCGGACVWGTADRDGRGEAIRDRHNMPKGCRFGYSRRRILAEREFIEAQRRADKIAETVKDAQDAEQKRVDNNLRIQRMAAKFAPASVQNPTSDKSAKSEAMPQAQARGGTGVRQIEGKRLNVSSKPRATVVANDNVANTVNAA